jgi:hypothetical protein
MQTSTPQHPSAIEHSIAVAIVLWIIVAGLCVLAANAWALDMIA